MAASHRVIKGRYVRVVDGDTAEFRPADRERFEEWRSQQSIKARVSGNGSVTLRFQGIDTPELHYPTGRSCFFVGRGLPEVFEPSYAQPFGRAAEVGLKQAIGLRPGGPAANGAILVEGADGYGRLIAYALPNTVAAELGDGDSIEPSAALLEQSFNCAMLDKGLAYPLAYSSMLTPHRALFRDHAAEARRQEREIWGRFGDTTREFRLRDEGSIDQLGRLIYPKLFRRCIDYLFAVSADDFRGDLKEWIVKTSRCGRDADGNDQSQDDPLAIEGQAGQRRLSELIECNGEVVSFDVDLFRLVFIDRRPQPVGGGPDNV